MRCNSVNSESNGVLSKEKGKQESTATSRRSATYGKFIFNKPHALNAARPICNRKAFGKRKPARRTLLCMSCLNFFKRELMPTTVSFSGHESLRKKVCIVCQVFVPFAAHLCVAQLLHCMTSVRRRGNQESEHNDIQEYTWFKKRRKYILVGGGNICSVPIPRQRRRKIQDGVFVPSLSTSFFLYHHFPVSSLFFRRIFDLRAALPL